MLMYNIHLSWSRETEDFKYETYNRKHTVFFNGGPKIEIDSSANLIRNPHFQCPEELLIASLSSGFMLTFLSICSKDGLVVNNYTGQAYCHLDEKKNMISEIILCPEVVFEEGYYPGKKALQELFQKAQSLCFIANSLKTSININPTFCEE